MEFIFFILENILKTFFSLEEKFYKSKNNRKEQEAIRLFKSKSDKLTFKFEEIITSINCSRGKLKSICRVKFTIDYNGVKIKVNRTFDMEEDRLRFWFTLQEKLDIYIFRESSSNEDINFEENYIEEINFSSSHYCDGKYIYKYYLDFSFMNN